MLAVAFALWGKRVDRDTCEGGCNEFALAGVWLARLIVAGVALYFSVTYVAASIAIGSGLEPFYQQSVRAMWIGFCSQLALLAAVLLYAAAYPRTVSRQFVTVLALMPMLSTVMLFWFAASRLGGLALGIAAALMLIAAFTWPARGAGEPAVGAQVVRLPGGPRAP